MEFGAEFKDNLLCSFHHGDLPSVGLGLPLTPRMKLCDMKSSYKLETKHDGLQIFEYLLK